MEKQRQPFNYGEEFISSKLEDLVGFYVFFKKLQLGSPSPILQNDPQAERSVRRPPFPGEPRCRGGSARLWPFRAPR